MNEFDEEQYVPQLSDEWPAQKVKDQCKRRNEQSPQERVEPIACPMPSEKTQAPSVLVSTLSAPAEPTPVTTAPSTPAVKPEPTE